MDILRRSEQVDRRVDRDNPVGSRLSTLSGVEKSEVPAQRKPDHQTQAIWGLGPAPSEDRLQVFSLSRVIGTSCKPLALPASSVIDAPNFVSLFGENRRGAPHVLGVDIPRKPVEKVDPYPRAPGDLKREQPLAIAKLDLPLLEVAASSESEARTREKMGEESLEVTASGPKRRLARCGVPTNPQTVEFPVIRRRRRHEFLP